VRRRGWLSLCVLRGKHSAIAFAGNGSAPCCRDRAAGSCGGPSVAGVVAEVEPISLDGHIGLEKSIAMSPCCEDAERLATAVRRQRQAMSRWLLRRLQRCEMQHRHHLGCSGFAMGDSCAFRCSPHIRGNASSPVSVDADRKLSHWGCGQKMGTAAHAGHVCTCSARASWRQGLGA
jgi:hypothetical protein